MDSPGGVADGVVVVVVVADDDDAAAAVALTGVDESIDRVGKGEHSDAASNQCRLAGGESCTCTTNSHL